MSAPWCPESGRTIKYLPGHRTKCQRCGKRVLVIGHRLTKHRIRACGPSLPRGQR